MNLPINLLYILLGFLLGGGLVLLIERARSSAKLGLVKAPLEQELSTLRERLSAKEEKLLEVVTDGSERARRLEELQGEIRQLHSDRARLEETISQERKNADEKLSIIHSAQAELSNAFKALSAEALKSNNQSFVELATTHLGKFQESAKGDLEKRQQAISEIIKPVRETLEKFDLKVQDIEKARVGAYEGLVQQVKGLEQTHLLLRSETQGLRQALGTPRVRGRWGEIQLKRVVEIAGMLEYCDFFEQQSVTTEDGKLRPDLIVRLPAGRNIVVDAKTPLAGYLEALDAQDEVTKKIKLADHARHVREHLADLSRKAYWEQFQPSPEFVILFLPGETFFSAALEEDGSLIEQGAQARVLIATPTTLITLLRTVAYGWKQEKLAENAQEICNLGQDLHKRLGDLAGHFSEVGKNLARSVDAYNKAVGNLESRVLVTARKFKELEASGVEGEIESPLPVDGSPRALQAPELSQV